MTTIPQPTADHLVQEKQWSVAEKILFRFFFTYFFLYCFPFPLDVIEWTSPLTKPVYKFQDWWVMLSGKFLFNIHVHNYGNMFQRTGDLSYGYVFVFTLALLSLIVAAAWTMFASKMANYHKLYQWFKLYVRFFLAFHLFGYGFIKVFPSQFPDVTASTLVKTFGDATPAGLAWNFMGYSETFMRFTGLAEVAAGFLLLFRRTTTLGALLSIAVLSAVVMMNFCFRIGVKLFSLHFLVIAIILFFGDSKRFVQFFILNKPVEPMLEIPLIQHRVGRKILLLIQAGLVIWMLYTNISDARESQLEYGNKFPKPPLYGVYKTEYFVRNHDTIPALETDSLRWKQLVIDDGAWKWSSIHFSNDSSKYFSVKVDSAGKTILMLPTGDTSEKYHLNYSYPGSNRILITGLWKSDTIEVMMKEYDLNNYRLHRSKFQWMFD